MSSIEAFITNKFNASSDQFFSEFAGSIVVFMNSDLVTYDQSWVAETNPLDKKLWWAGFRTTSSRVSMTMLGGQQLNSPSAGGGLYPGVYNVESMSITNPGTPPVDGRLILNCSVRLGVQSTVDNSSVFITTDVVREITGTIEFKSLPLEVANEFLEANPLALERCVAGTYQPAIVCSASSLVATSTVLAAAADEAARQADQDEQTTSSAVPWSALGVAIAAFVLGVSLLIVVMLKLKN